MAEYVVYKRVSTGKQEKSGLGLEAQERDIRLYLSSYDPDGSVLAEFVEVQSGAKENREQLDGALQLCRDTGATLLVAKLDRLSRKVSTIATLMDDKRLSLRVASMPHADKFQLHIYAALAEQERDFISKRTKAALAEAKARGVVLGGARPESQRRHDTVRQEALDRAIDLAPRIKPLRDRGYTYQGIADHLNNAGVETPKGGKWHPASVRNVFQRLG